MQISNSVISQYLNGTVNNSQQTARPVQPVTIEGQLIDDEKKHSGTNKTEDTDFAEPEQSGNEIQAALIAPENTPLLSQNITFEPLLIQKKQRGNSAVTLQNESLSAAPNFPYGHRRSFAGLAGGSLVIQNYLNNESPASTQSDNAQRYIDLFI